MRILAAGISTSAALKFRFTTLWGKKKSKRREYDDVVEMNEREGWVGGTVGEDQLAE
jgi:hypothetical protein